MRCLFILFAHFLKWVGFLLLSFIFASYILDNTSLSDFFATIFSQSVASHSFDKGFLNDDLLFH